LNKLGTDPFQAVHVTRHFAAGVLVESVDGITRRPEARATIVPAGRRRLAIANRVEHVLEMLPGNGRAVAPILFPARHLPERVVRGHPAGIVGVRRYSSRG